MADPQLDLRALAAPVDEARLQHNLQGVRARQLQRKVRRARLGASLASLAACALLALFAQQRFLPGAAAPGPLNAVADQRGALGLERLQADATQPRQGTVTLDDGSRIHLASHSRLELVENSGERVRSVLHDGWARFEVKPGGPRRWIVDAGLAEVQVVGTAFTVSTSHAETRVRVHHGRVLVRSALVESGLAQLNAGDELHLRARPQETAASEPQPVPNAASEAAPASPASDQPTANAALQVQVEPLPALGTAAAADASGAEAAAPVRADAPFTTRSPRVVSTLRSALEQADALRAQGEPRRAAQLLARELWAHPGAEGLGLTALTLAQLQLDELHEPAQAARSFALAHQAAGLPPALREQALARQVEALVRANQIGAARARADEYARRYPAGAWLPAVRDWLSGAE